MWLRPFFVRSSPRAPPRGQAGRRRRAVSRIFCNRPLKPGKPGLILIKLSFVNRPKLLR